jgi:hypothetical protein
MADWGGIDVVTDPYTLADQGIIKVTTTILTDIAVRQAAAFCVSTDTSAA